MPHRFNHLADQGILAIAFFGLVTMAERIEALRLLVHEHELTGDYRLLADFRQANVVPELPAEPTRTPNGWPGSRHCIDFESPWWENVGGSGRSNTWPPCVATSLNASHPATKQCVGLPHSTSTSNEARLGDQHPAKFFQERPYLPESFHPLIHRHLAGEGDQHDAGFGFHVQLKSHCPDFRDAELQPGSGELMMRHAENLAAGYKAVSGTRIAYLVGATTGPSSLKMMAASRGYFYQRFTDRAAALRWLRFSRAE